MSLQRFTTEVCHALLRFPEQMVPACNAKVSHINVPSCTMWERQFIKYVTKYDANSHSTEQNTLPIVFIISDVNPHSIEQDTQPIVFLISRQVVLYRTCGGTYYPAVSTPKIQSLVDLSTTCHDAINHLYHSNRCSNHSIDPHTVNSHLDG
jgi:hypothetical protein